MHGAVIGKANAVIIAEGSDDSIALIVLSAGHVNPTVRIISSAKEEEDVKRFKQGEASAILSQVALGGYILAAAADQGPMVRDLDDLLGGRCSNGLVERTAALLSGSRPGGHAAKRQQYDPAFQRPERQPGLIDLHNESRPTRSFPLPA